MSLVQAFYAGVPALTVPINAGLAYWIYTHHDDVRGSPWFVATLGLAAAWMAMATVQHVVSTPTHQVFFSIMATKFAVWSFMTNVVFASQYSRADFHEHWLVKGLLGTVVGITLLPTWMEPFQSLLYEGWTVRTEPFQYVVNEPGPAYSILGISLAILTAYALYVLVRYMLSTPRRSGLQLALLVVGSLSIMIAITLGNAGVFPIQEVTNAQFGALPFAVFISIALFRFRLFEMQPVARNAVVENLRDPVLVLDSDMRIVDYNAASAAIWTDIGDRVGEAIEVAAPDVADEITITDGTIEATSRFSVLVDGRRRHYSLNVSTVGEKDDADLYAVLFRDVTDLEQSRYQLEKQNERLDQVAATISHDLRNPINVADGYAEIVDELLEGGTPSPEDVETARDNLQRIRGAHDRMEAIIDDVLTLAREGQTVEETEALMLAAVAHEAWEHVATGDATLTIAEDRPLAADRTRLLTFFENLVRNAVEHGGETVEVTVGALEDGFYIDDDGPGIPEEHASDVFEYGYTTEDEGTGLGLSIVRTIAESHGWTVEIDGDYEEGTRFVVHNVDVEPTDDADERWNGPEALSAVGGRQ